MAASDGTDNPYSTWSTEKLIAKLKEAKSMFWILFLCTTIPTAIGEPHVQYLMGVQRFNMSGYTDYYFSCSVIGNFLQWEYNSEPLRGFGIQDTGVVVVITRPTYEYTATLLSSQLDTESNQRRLDSVMVLSFESNHSSTFEVTCSSSSDYNTIQVNGMYGNVMSNSSSNGEVVLDHIISTEIVQNKNRTHIFICGVQNDQQFYEILSGSLIGFNEHDHIGQARTDLSHDSNFVRTQSVLFARLPYQKTSLLLIITNNLDVAVTCYFGTYQAAINFKAGIVESTDPPLTSTHTSPSTHTAPITNTTSDSFVSEATTMLFSTSYEIDDKGFTESSYIVYKTVGIVLGGVGVALLCGAITIIIAVSIKYIKGKISIGLYSEEPQTENKEIVLKSIKDSPLGDPPIKASEVSGKCACVVSSPTGLISDKSDRNALEPAVSLKRGFSPLSFTPQNLQMKSDPALGGIKPENYFDELVSFCGHACQNSMEESNSEETSLRICESSTYCYGHEYGGTELVKPFGSLQETSFIGTDGLEHDYWNFSVNAVNNGNPDEVTYEESPTAVAVAVAGGNAFKLVYLHSKDDNVYVTEEDICVINNAHDNIDTEEHVCFTDDAHDDVRIMKEDEDTCAFDKFFTMEEGKDTYDDVYIIMEEDKDTYDNVCIIMEEDKDAHDHVRIMEEDEDAQSDISLPCIVMILEDNEAQCKQNSNYLISDLPISVKPSRHTVSHFRTKFLPFHLDIPTICYSSSMYQAKEVDLTEEKLISSINKILLKLLACYEPRWSNEGITTLEHEDSGSMDKRRKVCKDFSGRFLSMESSNVKEQLVYSKTWRKKMTFPVSIRGDSGGTGAVTRVQMNSFKHCFLPITITGVELQICKSITDILQIVQLIFRMVLTLFIMQYFKGLLWFMHLCQRSQECQLWGGTLHVPVVGTSSWWGRVRLDLLNAELMF